MGELKQSNKAKYIKIIDAGNKLAATNVEDALAELADMQTSGSGDKTYTHNQITASASWTITHNLNKYPSVTVVDSGDSVAVGEVTYLSNNSLRLDFTSEFSGKAYLN